MDEERRLIVAKLAMAESRARARVDALGARNVTPLNAEQRVALDVEYALARAEWVEALDDLRAHVYPSEAVMAVLARARAS
jgi:hypothetical protein